MSKGDLREATWQAFISLNWTRYRKGNRYERKINVMQNESDQIL